MTAEDEHSGSSSGSDSEDVEKTGLIATRAKRSTAGNLYATLRANLDDEELQKELLAEDADDVGDYQGSDREDDDAAFESSSDDEDDAGPAKEGEPEDLTGEQELKKAERAEAGKKRKARDARLKLPSWQKKKHVKIADDVKTADGPQERPKKKAERASRFADGPIRQSNRASARASREITHANLKESHERSEKQRKVMKNAAEREKTTRRMDLTAEERLLRATKVEKETKREFGRWEREEAERQRIRDEILAAKRQKGIDGPYLRFWSGSAMWQGNEIKVKRVVSERKTEEEGEGEEDDGEEEVEPEKSQKKGEDDGNNLTHNVVGIDAAAARKRDEAGIGPVGTTPEGTESKDADVQMEESDPSANKEQPMVSSVELDATSKQAKLSDPSDVVMGDGNVQTDAVQDQNTSGSKAHQADPGRIVDGELSSNAYETTQTDVAMGEAFNVENENNELMEDSMLLEGIHEYASLPFSETRNHPTQSVEARATLTPIQHLPPPQYFPSAPYMHLPATRPQGGTTSYTKSPFPGAGQFSIEMPKAPRTPSLPLKQAQRCLLILDQFDKLATAPTSSSTTTTTTKRSYKTTSNLEPTDLASILIPDSYPRFTPDEAKYLTVKALKKRGGDLPPKIRCALTSWAAKYRDPHTGLAYADMHTYKIIQRILAGGCQWSSFLGAWVGPAYGSMGRPAHGVPEGFARPVYTKPVVEAAEKNDEKK